MGEAVRVYYYSGNKFCGINIAKMVRGLGTPHPVIKGTIAKGEDAARSGSKIFLPTSCKHLFVAAFHNLDYSPMALKKGRSKETRLGKKNALKRILHRR